MSCSWSAATVAGPRAFKLTKKVPLTLGVPEIMPVVLLIERPLRKTGRRKGSGIVVRNYLVLVRDALPARA